MAKMHLVVPSFALSDPVCFIPVSYSKVVACFSHTFFHNLKNVNMVINLKYKGIAQIKR